MKFGKKIGAAGLAVVLSAGMISAGVVNAQAATVPDLVSTNRWCDDYCNTDHFPTTGAQKVRVTIENKSADYVRFSITEDVKTFVDFWEWSPAKSSFVQTIKYNPLRIEAGEKLVFDVQTNASQSIFKNKVQGIYVRTLGTCWANALNVTFSSL